MVSPAIKADDDLVLNGILPVVQVEAMQQLPVSIP